MYYICAHVWKYVHGVKIKGPSGKEILQNGRRCTKCAKLETWPIGR